MASVPSLDGVIGEVEKSPVVDATANVQSSEGEASVVNDDEDLDDLLKGALDDFEKLGVKLEKANAEPSKQSSQKPKSSPENSAAKQQQQPSLDFDQFANVDDVLKTFMDQDPQLKKHWEQLAESCSKAAQATTDEDFEASISDTLKNLTENAKSIAGDSDISQEELSKIWANLGMNEGGGSSESGGGPGGMLPDIMPLVTNMMQNLLSKDVLYPALKDLTAKYPEWLSENKEKISEDELKRYAKQLELMEQVCNEFDAESGNESSDAKKDRFQRILVTMQKMQECGSPPKDLVGDVPDLGAPGADFDFSKIPGMAQNGANAQCSIM